MSAAPFEQFIKNLLDQTAAADALRDLTKRNVPIQGSSLMSAVESILLEETISAQFNPDGYESKEKKQAILSKLYLLKNNLDRNLVYPDHQDYVTVQLCIKYVEDGYSLTKESLECLNLIHKRNA
jgi:hypothetical protein